jgi:hypothetical protein
MPLEAAPQRLDLLLTLLAHLRRAGAVTLAFEVAELASHARELGEVARSHAIDAA